ncbi:hypothetical protein, partial [Hyphomonas atlantica]|uniref:hypothetical protein n=1 Tax=Hyphomonas atlantica TaxID=1280948 RepID=UPI0032B2E5E4
VWQARARVRGSFQAFYGCVMRARSSAAKGASGTPASSCGQANRAEKATNITHCNLYGTTRSGFQFAPSPSRLTIRHIAKAARTALSVGIRAQDLFQDFPRACTG